MKKFIMITGGARSGKSYFSEETAMKLGNNYVYIATMQAFDSEMKERIKKHRARRGKQWRTFEEPLNVAALLRKEDKKGRVFLIDCLTLFISNNLLEGRREEAIKGKVEELAELCSACKASVVIVTNEVGMGIVPDNKLGREFRDIQGKANQIIAAAADEAYFMVSGLPIKLK
jgi:adenosyl cobinamide kinase/adenosyl cobinamide phosphate guanylyltransferase